MTANEIIFDVSKLVLGGVGGAILNNWYKDIKSKKNDRRRMFLRLLSSKSYLNITQEKIEDLNMLPILFRGKKKILEKYYAYYTELSLPENRVDYQHREMVYLDLLREIGNEVGYKNLDNNTLDTRYIPTAALDEHNFSKEMKEILMKYLQSGNELQEAALKNMKDAGEESSKLLQQ